MGGIGGQASRGAWDSGRTHRRGEGIIAEVKGPSSPGKAATADMLNCALLGDVTLVERFAHRGFSTPPAPLYLLVALPPDRLLA
jgi:hypothetical protein